MSSFPIAQTRARMPDSLVLVHGALGDIRQLAPLATFFADRPTHVVELEGHGSTLASEPRYSIERFAQQLRDTFVERGITRAHVFGYSMGGYVALHLAAQSPHLVASVATLGTKLAWSPEVARKETSRLDPVTIRAKVPTFADLLERRHAGAGGWESVLSKTAALMTELGDRPVVDDGVLARLEAPVRLLVGDRDNVVSVQETMEGGRRLAKGEFGVLPATPHPFEQVRVELVASTLRDFLSAER